MPMTTKPMVRPTEEPDPPRQRDKAPIPAAVAALVSAFRSAFKRAEDEHSVAREGDRVQDTLGWRMEFVVERDELDGGFVAECPQLPGAMGQGETEQEALDSLADAVDGIVTLRLHRRLEELDVDMSPVESVRVFSIRVA